jgi:hypothetical protein
MGESFADGVKQVTQAVIVVEDEDVELVSLGGIVIGS